MKAFHESIFSLGLVPDVAQAKPEHRRGVRIVQAFLGLGIALLAPLYELLSFQC